MSQPQRRARQAPSPVLLHPDNQSERQAQADRVIMRAIRQHATVETERRNGAANNSSRPRHSDRQREPEI